MKRAALRGLAAALIAFSMAAAGQQAPKVHRVGFIATTSPVSELLTFNPASQGFIQGMRELGYVEGKNLKMEWRSAEGKFERFPGLIKELLALKVEVLVTVTNAMHVVAKDLTRTVPIVMAASANPVEAGLVKSLARPDGNITGLTLDVGPELFGKRLQLLRQIVPSATRIAVFGFADGLEGWKEEEAVAAARTLGATLHFIEPVHGQYAEAFAAAKRGRADVLLQAQSALGYGNRRLIAELAVKHRLAAIYPARDFVIDGGGLASYGANIGDIFRRAAEYVDRILKGAKPADLPIERPTKFELVINLRAAREIGLTIPKSVLAQADQVIE